MHKTVKASRAGHTFKAAGHGDSDDAEQSPVPTESPGPSPSPTNGEEVKEGANRQTMKTSFAIIVGTELSNG